MTPYRSAARDRLSPAQIDVHSHHCTGAALADTTAFAGFAARMIDWLRLDN
jgi:hypothetical protein